MLDERAARASSPLTLARPRAGRAVSSARDAVASVPAAVWVAAIVAVSALLRFVLAAALPAPSIIPDELIYSELANSFGRSGRFLVRDEPFSVWSFGPLYPILIAPVYRFSSAIPEAYPVIKAINCLLFSSAAVPAYLLGRRLLRPSSALLGAAFTVAVPSAVYTTKVMTESLTYPVFLWTVLAIVSVLERPSTRRQLLALGAIVVASLCRAQMIALLPALVSAVLVGAGYDAWLAEGRLSRRKLRRNLAAFRATWATLGIVLGAIAVGVAAKAGSTAVLLGHHMVLFDRIHPVDAPLSLLYHVAELDLYVGVIPLAASIVVGASLLQRSRPMSARVFAIAAASISIWLLVLVAVYASQAGTFPRIYDRYAFYLAPLLCLGFLAWIEHGSPRPRGWTRIAALSAFALPLTVPYGELLSTLQWSTVALMPWVGIYNLTGIVPLVLVLIGLYALALGRLFFRVEAGRSMRVLATAVALNFFGLSFVANVRNGQVSKTMQELGVGAEPGWVDAAVDPRAQVAAIWSGRLRAFRGPYALWETEFFNRSVGRSYYLQKPLLDDSPSTKVLVRGDQLVTTGGKPLAATYVLTDASVPIAAERVAEDRRTGLVLYQVGGRVRLRPQASASAR